MRAARDLRSDGASSEALEPPNAPPIAAAPEEHEGDLLAARQQIAELQEKLLNSSMGEARALRELSTERQRRYDEVSALQRGHAEQLAEMERARAANVMDATREAREHIRREVVKQMCEDWGGNTKVVESMLLEQAMHSPGSAELVERAAAAAAEEMALRKESAAAEAKSGDEGEGANSAEAKQPEWAAEQWLSSLGVSELVSEIMLSRAGPRHAGGHLVFVRTLAADEKHGREALLSLLRVGLLEKLSERVWDGMQKLRGAGAGSGVELNAKFLAEGDAFTMSYGGLSMFFGGLEGLVGPPNPNLGDAMANEHCNAIDSKTLFRTSNYGIDTRSDIEYYFVCAPEKGRLEFGASSRDGDGQQQAPAGAASVMERWWPQNRAVPVDTGGNARRPIEGQARIEFEATRREVNAKLMANNCAPCCDSEVFGGRLYTGPMFQKYNSVLRGVKADANTGAGAHMRKVMMKLTKGNTYVTTLHCINSVIIKLGKLTKAAKVYRGISGGVLPDEFWTANAFGVRGGVEYAFTSTTTNREVALKYASTSKVGMVLEVQMGMVDRGAELEWLSQYPAEKEICFAPLTGVEVQNTRVDGSLLIVEARFSVNLTALTIEEVVAKMQRSQVQLISTMYDDLAFGGAPRTALAPLAALRSELSKRDPSYFNDAEHFREATSQALNVQHEVFQLLTEDKTWEERAEDDAPSADGAVLLGTTVVEQPLLTVQVVDLMLLSTDEGAPPKEVVLDAQLLGMIDALSPFSNRTNRPIILEKGQALPAQDYVIEIDVLATDVQQKIHSTLMVDASSRDEAAGLQLELHSAGRAASTRPVGYASIDIDSLLIGRQQELDLLIVNSKGLQVGRLSVLIDVPAAALALPERLRQAASMRDVAALCARAGRAEEAVKLLKISQERMMNADEAAPDAPAMDVGPGQANGGEVEEGAVTASRCSSMRQLVTASVLSSTNWRISAAEKLLKTGAEAPWPATLVKLAVGNEARFAEIAMRGKRRDLFAEGSFVSHGRDGFFQKGCRVISSAGVGGKNNFKLKSLYGYTYAPAYEVFSMGSSDGLPAVMREAAAAGERALVQALLAANVSPFETDATATTALHRAAAAGHADVCRVLCLAGAAPQAKNASRFSAVTLAVLNQHIAARRVFMPSASDKDLMAAAIDKEAAAEGFAEMWNDEENAEQMWSDASVSPFVTPLMRAARKGDLEEVRRLMVRDGTGGLSKRTLRRCTALLMAAEEGHVEVITALYGQIKTGEASSSNQRKARRADETAFSIDDADEDGCTALFLAAANGKLRAVEKLLSSEYSARVDAPNKKGETPLFIAAWNGYDDVVRMLLERKADASTADSTGLVPMEAAAQNGRVLVSEVLLETMACDENIVQKALDRAAEGGHSKVVRLLLRKAQDKTPMRLQNLLFSCIRGDHEAAARMLVAAGADLSRTLSMCDGKPACTKILLEILKSGAPGAKTIETQLLMAMSTSVSNSQDEVALMLASEMAAFKMDLGQFMGTAAEKGRTEIVYALLAAGAKDSRERNSRSALMQACMSANVDVVRVLLRSGIPPSAVDVTDHLGATALCYAAGFNQQAWGASILSTDHEFINGPGYEIKRTKCVELLLSANEKNYTSKNWESHALALQKGRAAMEMARLAGFHGIVKLIEEAERKESMLLRVNRTFQVRQLQTEVLDKLQELPHAVLDQPSSDSVEDLRRQLESRAEVLTGTLRSWIQHHEQQAIQLWQTPPAAPQLQESALADGEAQAPLLDEKIARELERLTEQKETCRVLMQRKNDALIAERSLFKRLPHLSRRLRGDPITNRPMNIPDGESASHFATRINGTHGLPENVIRQGVYYYEVQFEQAEDLLYQRPKIGFALESFDTEMDGKHLPGIGDVIGDRTVEESKDSWCVGYTLHTAHSGSQYERNDEFTRTWVVGDVIGVAVNVTLGQIALCINGSWNDSASRVVVVDERIRQGVFPAFSVATSYHSMAKSIFSFRTGSACEVAQPDDNVWDNAANLEAALQAGDWAVAKALAKTEQEHEWLRKAKKAADDRRQELHDLEAMPPAELESIVDKLLQGIENGNHLMRQASQKALIRLEKAALSEAAVRVAERLSHKDAHTRHAALETLATLDATALAKHTDKIVNQLKDMDGGVRKAALNLIDKLDKDALASQHLESLSLQLGELHRSGARATLLQAFSKFDSAHIAPYTPAIAARLQDNSYGVRQAAAAALSKLVSATLAEQDEHIAPHLRDAKVDVRLAALSIHRELDAGTLATHASSIVALLSDEDEPVWKAAFETLDQLEPAALAQRVVDIEWCLKDMRSDMRIAALNTLAKLKQSALSEHLGLVIPLLWDKSDQVRRKAQRTLGMLSQEELTAHAPQLVAIIDRATSIGVRDTITEVVGRVPPSTLQMHAGEFERLLGHAESNVRVAALTIIAMLETSSLRAHLASAAKALMDESNAVKLAAVNVFAKLDVSDLIVNAHVLVPLLDNDDGQLPQTVATALAKMSAMELDAYSSQLASLSQHNNWAARAAALQVMAHLSAEVLEEQAEIIIKVLEQDGDSAVRSTALVVLDKLDPSALAQHAGTLEARLDHEQIAVRKAALEALSKLDSTVLFKRASPIIRMLSDADESVRDAAVGTLHKLSAKFGEHARRSCGQSRHAERIVMLLGQRESGVQQSALSALSALPPKVLASQATRIASLLGDGDATVQVSVLNALSKMTKAVLKRHAALIVSKLKASEETVRAAAAEAMLKLPWPTLKQYVHQIFKRLEVEPGANVKFTLFCLLDSLQGSVTVAMVRDCLPDLIRTLDKGDDQYGFMRFLKHLQDLQPSDSPELLKLVQRHASSLDDAESRSSYDGKRDAVLTSLSSTFAEPLVPQMVKLYASSGEQDFSLNNICAYVLGSAPPAALERHMDALLPCLKHPEKFGIISSILQRVRRSAIPQRSVISDQLLGFLLAANNVSMYKIHVPGLLQVLRKVEPLTIKKNAQQIADALCTQLEAAKVKDENDYTGRIMMERTIDGFLSLPAGALRTHTALLMKQFDSPAMKGDFTLLPKLCKVVMANSPHAIADLLHHPEKKVKCEALKAVRILPAHSLHQYAQVISQSLTATPAVAAASEPVPMGWPGSITNRMITEALLTICKLEPSSMREHIPSMLACIASETLLQSGTTSFGQPSACIEALAMRTCIAKEHPEKVITFLTHKNARVREVALAVIEKGKPASALLRSHVPAIMSQLDHTDGSVRAGALRVLAGLEPFDALAEHAEVIEAKLDDKNLEVRAAGLRAIAARGDQQVLLRLLPKIHEALDGDNDSLASAALTALAAISGIEELAGRSTHVATLLEHLEAKQKYARGEATEAALRGFSKCERSTLALAASAIVETLLQRVAKFAVVGSMDPYGTRQSTCELSDNQKQMEAAVQALRGLVTQESTFFAGPEAVVAKWDGMKWSPCWDFENAKWSW